MFLNGMTCVNTLHNLSTHSTNNYKMPTKCQTLLEVLRIVGEQNKEFIPSLHEI